MLNIDQLEGTIAEQMQAAGIPGLALAIIVDGAVWYAHGFGVTSVEDGGRPVTADTLFRVGSISKAFTAALVMRLVERGTLDLDAPLTTYLPRLRIAEGDVRSITLRALMSMTSGLLEGRLAPSTPTPARPFTGRDLRDLAAHVREDFPQQVAIAPPGALWWYNTGGTNLTGYLAEVTGGRPFAELMRDLVFAPLGMARTTYDPSTAMTYPVALPHARCSDGSLAVQRALIDYVWMYPGAFAFSTARDLARFALMHLCSGRAAGGSFLTPTSIATMHAPHGTVATATGLRYGLNLFLDTYKGLRRVGHDGVYFEYRSKLVMAPEAGVGVVVLHSRGEDWRGVRETLINGIFDALLDLGQGPAVTAPPGAAGAPGEHAGVYRNVEDGHVVTIRGQDARLALEAQGATVPLRPVLAGVYAGDRPEGRGLPRAPYIPTPTIGVSFISAAAVGTPHLMLNGKPYRRLMEAAG